MKTQISLVHSSMTKQNTVSIHFEVDNMFFNFETDMAGDIHVPYGCYFVLQWRKPLQLVQNTTLWTFNAMKTAHNEHRLSMTYCSYFNI